VGSGLHRIPVACREASNWSRHLGCHPQSLVSISRFLRMCGFYGFLSPSRTCWSPNRSDVSGASPASAMASICPNLATATFFREHLAARNKGYPWKTGIVDDVPWVTDNNMAISDGYVGYSEGSICTFKIGRGVHTARGRLKANSNRKPWLRINPWNEECACPYACDRKNVASVGSTLEGWPAPQSPTGSSWRFHGLLYCLLFCVVRCIDQYHIYIYTIL